MRSYWVYMTSNRSGGLYLGVTNNLERRVSEHKAGEHPGYAKRYRLNRLVYCEEFSRIREAIDREKQIKRWRREKKVALIESVNPEWRELAEGDLDALPQ